ncbi:MAG TPA: hypothetical protein VK507_04220 [Iamia sp.]|nr:hypothetical protein [Iamia sp.]
MPDTTPTNVQVLSAMDFGPGRSGVTPNLDVLVADLGGALLRVVTHQVADCRRDAGPDVTVAEHLLVFDAGRLRNTEAHGMGFRRGFVVCLRSTEDVAAELAAADEAARNLAGARRAVAETLRSARAGVGCLSITISLPRPWGAAKVFADGRVETPSGRPIPELVAA